MRLPRDPEAFKELRTIGDKIKNDEIRSECKHILTFGVIPEVTDGIKAKLVKELRDSHYGFILNSHNGTVNSAEDCFIFNVTLEVQLTENLRHFDNDPSIIERTMNQKGENACRDREKLYRGLF